MSSAVDVDKKAKDILIISEEPTQGLDDTRFTTEGNYPINFTQSGKRFVLSIHNHESNSLSFVNASKVYQFRVKASKIKHYKLGNVSKGFIINNMKKHG